MQNEPILNYTFPLAEAAEEGAWHQANRYSVWIGRQTAQDPPFEVVERHPQGFVRLPLKPRVHAAHSRRDPLPRCPSLCAVSRVGCRHDLYPRGDGGGRLPYAPRRHEPRGERGSSRLVLSRLRQRDGAPKLCYGPRRARRVLALHAERGARFQRGARAAVVQVLVVAAIRTAMDSMQSSTVRTRRRRGPSGEGG